MSRTPSYIDSASCERRNKACSGQSGELTVARGATEKSPASLVVQVYIDFRDVNWGDPCQTLTHAVTAGYNVVIIAFLLGGASTNNFRPFDLSLTWSQQTPAYISSCMANIHSMGAVVMVSAGGSTEQAYSNVANDGTAYGMTCAVHSVL
mgnify:CR=1 FL=1